MRRTDTQYLWHGFEARMHEDAQAGLGVSAPAATVSAPPPAPQTCPPPPPPPRLQRVPTSLPAAV
eukprot:6704110-Prymnesium_polylepis.1